MCSGHDLPTRHLYSSEREKKDRKQKERERERERSIT